jgi:hypothetical protein
VFVKALALLKRSPAYYAQSCEEIYQARRVRYAAARCGLL